MWHSSKGTVHYIPPTCTLPTTAFTGWMPFVSSTILGDVIA